jgi:selenocysteine-specific elongation factor
LERGIVAAPGAVQFWKGAIALVRKVPYYHGKLPQTSKFHISVGHTTIMAVATFWGAKELAITTGGPNNAVVVGPIVPDAKGVAAIELQSSSLGGNAEMAGLPRLDFDFNQDFIQQQDGYQESVDGVVGNGLNWALLDFQTPVYCPRHSLVIGSRLDTVDNESGSSLSSSACRLAFSGRLIERIEPELDGKRLRLYTPKEKIGKIARLGDPHTRSDDGKVVRYEVFGTDLFKKETNMKIFIGMKLETKDGDIGEIKSSFGTSGEFRVWFPAGTAAQVADDLILRFKRFANDQAKTMHQDICLPPARSGARIGVVKKKNEVGVHRQGEIVALKGDLLENGKHTIIIVAGFFAPEINIKEKAGTAVLIPATNDEGKVLGPFGKAGKCKVSFQAGTSAQVGQKAKLMI